MADITQELQQILAAVYGEDVRGSIHDAIDKINKVGEKVLDAGNLFNDGDPATGYFDKSVYINTDSYKILVSNGTTWDEVADLKGAGIIDIRKTGTSGNVDTYTITLSNAATFPFTVTNGTPGESGNKWYYGTAVSGTSTNPTQFTLTFPVNENDGYINPTSGNVYHCTQGAAASAGSLWVYDFTMTGGGGGASVWGGITGTLSDQTDLKNALDAKANTSDYEIKSARPSEFNISSAGELSLDNSVTSKLVNLDSNGEISGAHVNYDANNTVNDKIDGLGTSKADTTDLDEWKSEEIVTTDGTDNVVTFTGLDDSLAYDIYCDAINTSAEVKSKTGSGTNVTLVYKLTGSNVLVGITKAKLRIVK